MSFMHNIGQRIGMGLVWLSLLVSVTPALAVKGNCPPSQPDCKPAATNPQSVVKRKVLIIHSYTSEYPWVKMLRQGIFEEIHKLPLEQQPEIYEEQLDAARLGKAAISDSVANHLTQKYAAVTFDAVFTELQDAATFLLDRPKLFPGVPRYYFDFTAPNVPTDRPSQGSFVILPSDWAITLQTILQVLPQTRRIVVIGDKWSEYAQTRIQAIKSIAPRFLGKVQLEYWEDIVFDELFKRVGQLPKDTAILYIATFRDRLGQKGIPALIAPKLSQLASAPVFLVADSFLNPASVGGYMVSGDKEGHLIGRMIAAGNDQPLRLTPEQLTQALNGYYFEDSQLKRWGIPDERLPKGSIILNREKSLWESYRDYFIAVIVAFVLETLLIVALIRSNRQRRLAEAEILRYSVHLEERVNERTAELAKAKVRAEAASRAKSQFLASMSHELRTPLNAILGFSELMSHDEATTASQKEKLAIINRSGGYLLNLINDVLDISKIEAGRFELDVRAFNLLKLLNDINDMIKIRTSEKSLTFQLELAPDIPPYIKGDSGKLRQVLINLLGNAIKFTQEGGIVLRAHNQPLADATQVLLIIEVVDSGVGIPADSLNELFKPFVQLQQENPNVQGTGLGLAISKSLIELMNGTVQVDSVLGAGSTFRIELPVPMADAEELAITEDWQPVKSLAADEPEWRLLVVDDNSDNRILLVSILAEVGFQIRMAENGLEAIQIFEQWRPHLIWMDMRMPIMDGYEATAKIRQLPGGDKVKILALTASVFREQHDKIIEVGCEAVLHKPFQAAEIFSALVKHLGVNFIYQNQPSLLSSAVLELTPQVLATLPLAIRQQLHQAALNLDTEETAMIIEQIHHTAPDIANSLEKLAEHYQFEQIIQLTDANNRE